MGLLDDLFNPDLYGGQNGGLLGLLRSTQAGMQQYPPGQPSAGFPSPMPAAASAPPAAPPIFAPNDDEDAPAAPAAPAAAPLPPQPPATDISAQSRQPTQSPQLPPALAAPGAAPASPVSGFFNRMADGLQSVAQGGSLQGAITGRYTDPVTQQAQVANVTARALIAKGVDPQIAMAAVAPGNTEFLNTLLKQNFGENAHTQETDKDGNVWDVNKQTGQRTIALAAKDDKFQHVQTGESGLGQKSFGAFNTKTGETRPDAGTAPASDGLGDMSKTGAEYLATVPKAQQRIVSGMVDGTIQPPSSFALAKPYWQTMLAGAKNLDPSFDENKWTGRHTMANQLALSSNSSMGGILSNGESSFKHLAEYTGSAADLGNASHDFPGGGYLAHAQNAVGNSMGGSATFAKIKAINDNLGHYGQESTKFYAGTGGGVEERMNALKEMNPTSTSSEEMAAYAEKEKSLMLDRLNTKFSEIRNTYGDEQGDRIIAKHMPEIQQNIATIDANVAKLKGAAPATPTIQEGATATNPKTGQKIVFKNGKWQ